MRVTQYCEKAVILKQDVPFDAFETPHELNQLLGLSQELMALADSDGYLLKLNPAWERVLGWTDAELTSRPYMEFIHPEDVLDTAKAVAHLESGNPPGSFENRLICRDGSYRWLEWNATQSSQAGNIFVVGRDMTRMKEVQSQLLNAQKLEAIGILAGGIAHDFNNILGGVMGYVELLAESLKGSDAETEYLKPLWQGLLRGRELVRQMFRFGGQSVNTRANIHMCRIIHEVTSFLFSKLHDRIEFELVCLAKDDIVRAAPSQIHQIILNLCSNAMHAMRQTGGKLSIVVDSLDIPEANDLPISNLAPGQYLKVSFSDTGCGIKSEFLKNIFDPFYTTKDVGDGTGLGLSVIHGIIADLGGSIDVASTHGEGTRFDVFLPK